MKDGVKPRQYTVDSWEATFLSWSIGDQENALKTLASLHKHAKRGRLGPVAQPLPPVINPPEATTDPLFVNLPEEAKFETLPEEAKQ